MAKYQVVARHYDVTELQEVYAPTSKKNAMHQFEQECQIARTNNDRTFMLNDVFIVLRKGTDIHETKLWVRKVS